MKAETNDLMQYMNVGLSGLRGRHHPSLSQVITTGEVKQLRPHLKFLTGDYLTYERKYNESGHGNPLCRICRVGNESISHILTNCSAYNTQRNKILKEIEELCDLTLNNINFSEIKSDSNKLTQFILDPTSFNLQKRVHISDPIVPTMFKLSRNLCKAIHTERTRKLSELAKK